MQKQNKQVRQQDAYTINAAVGKTMCNTTTPFYGQYFRR